MVHERKRPYRAFAQKPPLGGCRAKLLWLLDHPRAVVITRRCLRIDCARSRSGRANHNGTYYCNCAPIHWVSVPSFPKPSCASREMRINTFASFWNSSIVSSLRVGQRSYPGNGSFVDSLICCIT